MRVKWVNLLTDPTSCRRPDQSAGGPICFLDRRRVRPRKLQYRPPMASPPSGGTKFGSQLNGDPRRDQPTSPVIPSVTHALRSAATAPWSMAAAGRARGRLRRGRKLGQPRFVLQRPEPVARRQAALLHLPARLRPLPAEPILDFINVARPPGLARISTASISLFTTRSPEFNHLRQIALLSPPTFRCSLEGGPAYPAPVRLRSVRRLQRRYDFLGSAAPELALRHLPASPVR